MVLRSRVWLMCDLFARAFDASRKRCNERRNYYTRMAGANKFSSLFGPKTALKLRGRSLNKFLRIKLLISQLAITTVHHRLVNEPISL